MSNAIVPIDLEQTMEIGRVMAASGFFEDARQANQAIVKVLAGRELGFGPFASMTGIHIIKGKPVIAANLYAAAIRASARYDYKVARLDDTGCELVFFEDGKEVGRSSFTEKDAKAAGLVQAGGPWVKFPRNMYFARAISNGAHWYCPDVFGGSSVYTPGELGEETTVDLSTGEIIDAPTVAVLPPSPVVPEPLPAKPPADLKLWLMGTAKNKAGEPELPTGWRDGLVAAVDRLTETDGHHALFMWAFGNSTGSRKALTNGQVHAIREWLQLHKDEAGVWMPSETALAELMTAYPVAKESYTPPEIPEGLKGAVEANAQSLHS